MFAFCSHARRDKTEATDRQGVIGIISDAGTEEAERHRHQNYAKEDSLEIMLTADTKGYDLL